jgi:predicted nucleic acid-binding protein
MIIYADTSALVKLFVAENHSDVTRNTLQAAQALGTGLLTRAELGSAFARGAKRGLLSSTEAQEARRRLQFVWPTWIRIAMNENLVSRAESLAWKYTLRGYDSVHLAAAQIWQEQIEHAVTLATFDQELWEAAPMAGLKVWPEWEPAEK